MIIEENPSLRKELTKVLQEAYPYAVKKAQRETKLPLNTFPTECPWSLKEVLDN